MRRAISTVSALAVAAVLPFVATPPANAAPPSLTPAPQADKATKKLDNRPSPQASLRTAQRKAAVEQLVSGDATLKGKGSGRTIQLADGSEVDYPASQKANLLTFLVEFGDDDPADLADPSFPTEGPSHNDIPEPAASDNSTYWKADFNRQHFLDMFFNGMAEQDGESFKDLYDEMSSGRFDLEGDVSDWVQVPHAESYYSDAEGLENQPEMTAFIGDSANAWFAAQGLAGKTDAEIKDYLADYDVWDRYDADGDGDYNEPDGYIDHFQAVHAGEGEEAGAPIWTIWSHRWGANLDGYGTDGPTPSAECSACGPQGGVQIGDTGYWIGDYTTEPENGGLGVFAHEFGHDLGLPDYYDTGNGDNSNGYWTLMDSGSWLGHGEDSIGTGAGHMGPTEKLFLGWYGQETEDGFADLAVVDGTATTPQEVVLGPSYHATSTGKQAVMVALPDGHATADGPVASQDYLYSGTRDGTTALATSPTITLPAGTPQLTANVAYNIENGYDFVYLQASDDDGGTWTTVPTSASAAGGGITGNQLSFGNITADLTAYADEAVKLRWAYVTDGNTHGIGFLVRTLSVGSYSTNFGADNDWALDGFYSVVNGTYEYDFSQSYMAENRTFDGYDETLTQGPYSFDYANSAPNKVDHYSYEDGLLLYYSNGAYGDNNTSEHPGHGANLPVDAQPGILEWTGTGSPAAANGRLQSFDATFDVDQNSAVNLTHEVNPSGSQSVSVPARAAVPVFEDSDPNAYYDPTKGNGWFSTKVSGVGTEIQVLSSNETTGKMTLKIGKKFVAQTGEPSLAGGHAVGDTLTATAPTWFQSDVTTTTSWTRDGTPIADAAGSTYQIRPGDAGHQIAASFVGAKTGYVSTTDATDAISAVTGAAPTASAPVTVAGAAQVGQTLTAVGATWPVAGTSTFAWTIGGSQVGTGTTYVVKAADLGKTVTVTETFVSPGYANGTSTATTSAVGSGAAPSATAPPKIAGQARVGSKLTVTGGTWPVTGTSTFAWTIGGATVGTGPSYTLKPADAGKKVTVTETFTSPGYSAGTASATSGTVAKAPVTLKVSVGKAKKGKRVAATVRVSSPGPAVTGKVKVTYAGKKLGSFTLRGERVSLKLPARKKGSYRLTVSYPGATGFGTATKTITVRVK